MPIIPEQTPPPVISPIEEKAMAIAQYVTFVKNTLLSLFEQNTSVYNNTWVRTWKSTVYTPQEAFDALFADDPKNVIQLLTLSSAFGQAINAVVPNSVSTTPPQTITVNADGSVTLS